MPKSKKRNTAAKKRTVRRAPQMQWPLGRPHPDHDLPATDEQIREAASPEDWAELRRGYQFPIRAVEARLIRDMASGGLTVVSPARPEPTRLTINQICERFSYDLVGDGENPVPPGSDIRDEMLHDLITGGLYLNLAGVWVDAHEQYHMPTGDQS